MIDLTAILDSETSGLWRKDLPADSPDQPGLLQLACKVVDGRRRPVGRFSRIIRPEGYSVEPGAEAIHGISEAYAYQVGVPAWVALVELRASIEGVNRIVAHNVQFDRQVIEAAIARTGAEGSWWRSKIGKLFCTMEASAPILKLPGLYGDYKFPSLPEAFNALCAPLVYEPTHNADIDTDRTADIYFALRDLTAVR